MAEKKGPREPFVVKTKVIALPELADSATSLFQKLPPEKNKKISGLEACLEGCKGTEPVQNSEVNRLIQDMEVHKKSEPVARYTAKSLERVKALLEKEKQRLKSLGYIR